MAIVYRTIDPENYQEAYTFNLFWEYSWRDSSTAYVADSEDERKKKTDALIANLTRADRKYHYLAAFDDGAMAGAICLDRMLIDKRPACHVQGLWVHPDHRGRGIARRLKELGEDWAREMGSEFMDSNVRVDNRNMIQLNEQMGYEVARLNFRKELR
ncbi:GNAT family N-acetyltransferase [Lysobacter sp. CA199]|uniref:GNAT family N-acetyltransferase n=1 Tax=Lysobacter sp. CA199 TaxID=3455608 RepID=UPI003F8D7B2C